MNDKNSRSLGVQLKVTYMFEPSLRLRRLMCGKAVPSWQVESLHLESLNLNDRRGGPMCPPLSRLPWNQGSFPPATGAHTRVRPYIQKCTSSGGGKAARKLYVTFNCTRSLGLGLSLLVLFCSMGTWVVASDEVPIISYIPPSSNESSPISHISSSFLPGSSRSKLMGFKSVFQNVGDEQIVSMGVTWRVIDQSGKPAGKESHGEDWIFLGEAVNPCLKGSTIELISYGSVHPRAPVDRVELQVEWVELSSGKVWPDPQNQSPLLSKILNARRGASTFRRYLVLQFDRGGVESIREIIAKEKSRIAAEGTGHVPNQP